MLDVSYETLPAMRVKATGYGAAARYSGRAQPAAAAGGETDGGAGESFAEEPIAIIETVIDDSNPQCWPM